MERNKVVVVNEKDEPIKEADKMEAHLHGILHRAFSVFIFNSKQQMLIHKRAANKYHGAGLWTNACCSHPQWGEDIAKSALQRLEYEMGINCKIEKLFSFVYKAEVENGLVEHELDHVFMGFIDDEPTINTEEVEEYKWISKQILLQQVHSDPEKFTHWFRIAVDKVFDYLYI